MTPVDDVRRRYARWMHAYPPTWRRDHGEALIGTFLDAAEARGGTGPTRRRPASSGTASAGGSGCWRRPGRPGGWPR